MTASVRGPPAASGQRDALQTARSLGTMAATCLRPVIHAACPTAYTFSRNRLAKRPSREDNREALSKPTGCEVSGYTR
eukprot:1100008-Pyramimonas_sp.AAC.1